MDNFDFFRTSKHKINYTISSKYEGRYTKKEAFAIGGSGIAGLVHYENLDENNKFLKVNLELLKGGLAVYYRNVDQNNITIFSFDEIEEIILTKEMHLLVDRKFSIFRRMINLGFSFWYAKIFLLEDEIIAEYKPELVIKSKNYEDMVLHISRVKPDPIIDFLSKISSKVKIAVNIEEYKYI